jgi:TRAP transporter TAXI family solute receptor
METGCLASGFGPFARSGDTMKRSATLLLGLGMLALGCAERDITFVTIGTGGVTGVYYPTGGAISRMVNKRFKTYKIKATVESTSGSVFNINAVMNGDLEFGVAQSDRQYQAYHGLAEWAGSGPQTDLRSVFSVHPESITLVASDESGIREVNDLRGRRVNLGNPGSGQLQNSKDVLAAVGISEEDISAEYVKAVEAPGLLQDGRIDAFFYTVGHPAGNIKEATSGRIKVRLVPITGPGIEAMVRDRPYYALAEIPRDFYPGALNDEDVVTVGVKATFITSKRVSSDIVYAITREVFENLDDFRDLHPAYKVLSGPNMLKGLTAPIHPGALRYYRESGLIEHVDPRLIIDEAD